MYTPIKDPIDPRIAGLNTLVVSGFPGVGKSYLKNNCENKIILDSDSSNFSWEDSTKLVRNSEWPENYIKHIKTNIGSCDILLVSSHAEVRAELSNFILVYPDLRLKNEYIKRYEDRKSPEAFIKLLDKFYETWIKELMEQKNCVHCVLQENQYLSNLIK